MRKSTKITAALGGVALTVATAGAAYAYWTTTGSGSGAATAKTSNGVVVLTAHFANDALAPGLNTPVTFTAANAGATDLYVGTITLASVSTDKPGCVVTDFTMPNVTSNTPVIHGATAQAIAGTGTLSFANDPALSQDECKGAEVTLHLTSN